VIYYRRFKLARLFIEQGADLYGNGLYHRDLKGSPIEVAIKNTNQAAMELLIEKGINLNARICYWGTPLQLAAKLSERNTVSFLIEMGADVNACVPRAIFGSALEAAIFAKGHLLHVSSFCLQVIEMLLSQGASTAAVRPVGNVPLLSATLLLGRLELPPC
jgi:ankyrin repeat protein